MQNFYGVNNTNTKIIGSRKNMKIFEIENKDKNTIEQLVEVWESSVKATHLFLTEKERENIKNMYLTH